MSYADFMNATEMSENSDLVMNAFGLDQLIMKPKSNKVSPRRETFVKYANSPMTMEELYPTNLEQFNAKKTKNDKTTYRTDVGNTTMKPGIRATFKTKYGASLLTKAEPIKSKINLKEKYSASDIKSERLNQKIHTKFSTKITDATTTTPTITKTKKPLKFDEQKLTTNAKINKRLEALKAVAKQPLRKPSLLLRLSRPHLRNFSQMSLHKTPVMTPKSRKNVKYPVNINKVQENSPKNSRDEFLSSATIDTEEELIEITSDVSDDDECDSCIYSDKFEDFLSIGSDVHSDDEKNYKSRIITLTGGKKRMADTYPPGIVPKKKYINVCNPPSFLEPSLFPNVPPHIAFSGHLNKGPYVSQSLSKILKWRQTKVMPRLMRKIITNTGIRLLKNTNDWIGVWGKHRKAQAFKSVLSYQKVNHLPGSFKIGRKDTLWRSLQKLIYRFGSAEFGFMPKTYIFPHDLPLLRKRWQKLEEKNITWITKPPACSRGSGIRVVSKWSQIPKNRPLIVQKYIERPLLINGSKFDLRLYALVTSMNPLRVFLYDNGLARFASEKYSLKSEFFFDRCVHLTNYSINKYSNNYTKSQDAHACNGHKWSLKSLFNYLTQRGVNTDMLWVTLTNMILRTLISGEKCVSAMVNSNLRSRASAFELFGFDVLLDSDIVPWLLEVNISPSLHSDQAVDEYVKAPLAQAVLNTALFHVPPVSTAEKEQQIASEMSIPIGPVCYDERIYEKDLSEEEEKKHVQFNQKNTPNRNKYLNAILEKLTPDDVRCLIIAEDELHRSFPLERIFPTNESYKYLEYMETQRYYNRLLDAWETRYCRNRAAGVAILRAYCKQKYHLIEPKRKFRNRKHFETASDDKLSNNINSGRISKEPTLSILSGSGSGAYSRSSAYSKKIDEKDSNKYRGRYHM